MSTVTVLVQCAAVWTVDPAGGSQLNAAEEEYAVKE